MLALLQVTGNGLGDFGSWANLSATAVLIGLVVWWVLKGKPEADRQTQDLMDKQEARYTRQFELQEDRHLKDFANQEARFKFERESQETRHTDDRREQDARFNRQAEQYDQTLKAFIGMTGDINDMKKLAAETHEWIKGAKL